MRPYYVIDFNAVKCLIDIRVNDVSVLCMNVDGQISTLIPVNHAILELGKQQISYSILPLHGDSTLNASVRFSLSVWLYEENGDLIEKKEEIHQFVLPDNITGIPIHVYKGEGFFYANVPYKLNAWQNSRNLSEVENLKVLVNSIYGKIKDIINNAHFDQLVNLLQKREDNLAICMYFSEKEKRDRINELIEIINTGYQIVPVKDEDNLVMYGYDKLVVLRKPNGSSSLLLQNKEGDDLNLDFQFHLEQGENELTII